MGKSTQKIKLCYILPKFDLNTDTHYFYLYNLINKVSESMDMSLIIEKSCSDIKFFHNIKNIYVQKFSFKPLRILENLYLVILNRIKGYNNFYVHYSYIGAFNAGLISRITRAKTFYWSCGMMWLFGKDRFLNIILKLVSFLVTGVEVLKKGYCYSYKIKPSKVKIIPNWVDLDRFQNIDTKTILNKYNLDHNKKYILFIHRLVKRKGAHYIVPIAKNFVNDNNVEFLIAGDGPYEERLKKEITENNLSNIKLIGRVSNKEVPFLMKLSKVFFMPSEEEGFPRVLLESMASGLPYIAFDIGGVREISTDEQQDFICDIGDIKCISDEIRKLLDNDMIYNQLKTVNLEHVKQFDIRKVVNTFINLFNYETR